MLLLLLFLPLAASAGKVYVTRHGEKDWPTSDLNAEGRRRAELLADVFGGNASSFEGPPKAIFAHNYADFLNGERCYSTVKPLSDATGVPISFDYGGEALWWVGMPGGGGGNAGAAEAIKQALAETGGPVQVAWESYNMRFLATGLTGLDPEDMCWWDWSPKACAYDSVWVFEFAEDGSFVDWWKSAQDLNADGSRCMPTGCLKTDPVVGILRIVGAVVVALLVCCYGTCYAIRTRRSQRQTLLEMSQEAT